MPRLELSRRFRWISATNLDWKSRFEYDLDQILAGGRSNRISLMRIQTLMINSSLDVDFDRFPKVESCDSTLQIKRISTVYFKHGFLT